MAGIPVTVRKWLMDLGFDRRYGVRHAAGKRGVAVHKRATAAGRKYPAYI
jgi:hypothetical protein